MSIEIRGSLRGHSVWRSDGVVRQRRRRDVSDAGSGWADGGIAGRTAIAAVRHKGAFRGLVPASADNPSFRPAIGVSRLPVVAGCESGNATALPVASRNSRRIEPTACHAQKSMNAICRRCQCRQRAWAYAGTRAPDHSGSASVGALSRACWGSGGRRRLRHRAAGTLGAVPRGRWQGKVTG